MADQKITELTETTTVDDDDVFVVVDAAATTKKITGANLKAAMPSGSGTPGGSTGQVQFNDGGSFGGAAGFTFDDGVVSISPDGIDPGSNPTALQVFGKDGSGGPIFDCADNPNDWNDIFAVWDTGRIQMRHPTEGSIIEVSATGGVGFFGATPVAQSAAPNTLNEMLAVFSAALGGNGLTA